MRSVVTASNANGSASADSGQTAAVTASGGGGGGTGSGLHVSAQDEPCSDSAATTCSYLLDANGNVVHIHGVDLSGSEYACIQGWGIFSGAQNTQTDVAAMVAWHVNFVRIQLNEDCWLGINTSGISSSYVDTSPGVGSYATAIENLVTLLHQNGIYTEIVDMWNAPGTDQSTGQSGQNSSIGSAYFGPDEDHSPAMWASMAQAFANDPETILSPAGEEDVSMACQMDGCSNEGVAPSNVDNLGSGSYNGESGYYYNVAGLVSYNGQASQGAVGIMRANGYKGPIALECADYSSTCTNWLTYVDPNGTSVDTVSPSNILAEPHNYGTGGCTTQSCWDAQYLPVQEAGFPVFYGELGSATSTTNCGNTYPAESTSWADANGVGYMYWTWTVGTGDCFALPSNYTSGSSEIPPAAATFTGTTTADSTSITGVSSTSGLAVGQVVSGSGLPTGDTIISISGSTLTMGLDSTGSASGVSLTAQEGGPGWVKAHLESFVNAPAQSDISAGQPTYANSGAINPTRATDGTYNSTNSGGCGCNPGAAHYYQCGHVASTGSPCYVDVNVASDLPSSCNSAGTCKIIVSYYDPGGSWEEKVDGGGESYVYNAPGTYTIDACTSSCSGTPPSSGWSNLQSVSGSIVSSNVSPVLALPANTQWIRFYDTAPSPADASGNQDMEMNLDILNCTGCTTGSTDSDSWLFLGDSVTQYSMTTQEPSNFMQQMNGEDSQYYPVAIDAGVGSDSSQNEVTATSPITGNTYFHDVLNWWKGHYVALDYGGLSEVCSDHMTATSQMVAGLTYAGFQPVLRYSVTWTSAFSSGNVSSSEEINQLNAGPPLASGTCDGDGQTTLFSRYPTLLVGPDFWGFYTQDGTFPSSTAYENSSNVHPTHPAGENAYRQLYVQAALFNAHGN